MKKEKHIRFLLTGEQWLGIIILALLIIGTLVCVNHWQPQSTEDTIAVSDSTIQDFKRYQSTQDSLRKAQWKKKYKRVQTPIYLQPFDPNTADSCTLLHLGFKPWQAKNLIKYRSKGGVYRKPEDLKRLYGMTDSMYLALLPYIRIPHDTCALDTMANDSTRRDSIPHWYTEKKDTIINLRTADTTELKLIRGIGSYRAKQIVLYRERLGGFVDVEQLLELPCMKDFTIDSLLAHFIIDSIDVRPLNINSASVNTLSRHPYLRFEQAKAIYELRRKHIHLSSIQQLQDLPCLDQNLLERLTPYINFDKKH